MISASDIQTLSTSPPHTSATSYATATSSYSGSEPVQSLTPPSSRTTTIMTDSAMMSTSPMSPHTPPDGTSWPIVDRVRVPTGGGMGNLYGGDFRSVVEQDVTVVPTMARSAEGQAGDATLWEDATTTMMVEPSATTTEELVLDRQSVPETTTVETTGAITPAHTPTSTPVVTATATLPETAETGLAAGIAERLGRRILVVAMDDSTASQSALTWTLKQLVHPERDHLIVLTVAQYKIAGLISTNETKTAKRELKAEEKAQHVVDYAATHIGQWKQSMDVPLSFELVTLKAANADVRDILCEYSADIGASMLIVGAHSTGAVKRAILGSTATYCLHHATVPVIVVKESGTITAG